MPSPTLPSPRPDETPLASPASSLEAELAAFATLTTQADALAARRAQIRADVTARAYADAEALDTLATPHEIARDPTPLSAPPDPRHHAESMDLDTELHHLVAAEHDAAHLTARRARLADAHQQALTADLDTAQTLLPHALAALQTLARAGGEPHPLYLGPHWGGERWLHIAPHTGRITIRWVAFWPWIAAGALAAVAIAHLLVPHFVVGPSHPHHVMSVRGWYGIWGALGSILGTAVASVTSETHTPCWRRGVDEGLARLRHLQPATHVALTVQAVASVAMTRQRLDEALTDAERRGGPRLSLARDMATVGGTGPR